MSLAAIHLKESKQKEWWKDREGFQPMWWLLDFTDWQFHPSGYSGDLYVYREQLAQGKKLYLIKQGWLNWHLNDYYQNSGSARWLQRSSCFRGQAGSCEMTIPT
jgi:hypothetical protein